MKNSIMTPEEFAYWLQGYFEIAGTSFLSEAQQVMVKEHLAYVFQEKPSGYSGYSGFSGSSGYSGYC
jgi:hypothetical protein